MEKPNYVLWDRVETFRFIDIGYLWCDFEPPPDEERPPNPPRRSSRHGSSFSWFSYPRLKPKPLPPIVAHTFEGLIRAIIDGDLKLKEYVGKKNELPLQVNKSWKSTPRSINRYTNVYLTRKELKRYAKNIRLRPKFLFFDEQEATQPDEEIKYDIIRKNAPGINLIWSEIRKVGFSEKDGIPHQKKEKLWRNAALKKYDDIKIEYPQIDESFLDEKIFELNIKQQKRDFIGKLIQKIFINQGIRKPGSYQEIFKTFGKVTTDK